MNRGWSVADAMNIAPKTQVFSGGACNILNASGKLLRNQERDRINDWLTQKGIRFYDPQVHPETHDIEYDYTLHHTLEIAAREAAKINLYEVSPYTFGGITSFEIAMDCFRWHEPMVIYYSDGNPNADVIPQHSSKGHPLFVPQGIHNNEIAMKAHYQEFIKNGDNMRKYLMGFAREMNTLTTAFSDNPARGDVIITPDRMHATDLFEAIVRAASNQRVFVTFTGGQKARDARGNPKFVLPENPPEVEMHALLDQYVDEGNALRRKIAEMVGVSVYVRIVYTQESAILALSEVLKIKGLIQ